MIHKMKLHNKSFNLIKEGSKIIELRLYDEKRAKVKIDDIIEFTNEVTNEKINTRVVKLHRYDSFQELYKHFDKVSLGYKDNEEANYKDMEGYYSKEKQDKYGVVGIEIMLI